jgi:hypothetical protein
MQTLVVCAAVMVIAACPSRRDGLARDALERGYDNADVNVSTPTIAALLARRVPAPPPQPADIAGDAVEVAFATGASIDDARDVADNDRDEAFLLRCIQADAQRDYDDIVSSCTTFVERRSNDLRSAIVVALLTRHLSSLDLAMAHTIAERLAASACAKNRGVASCAPFAIAVEEYRLSLADVESDTTTTPTLAVASIEAEGPWLDGESHFRDGPKARVPMVPHPALQKRDIEVFRRRLRPAQGAPNGFYRLTYRGQTATDVNALVALSVAGPVEISVDGEVVFVRHSGDPAAALEGIPVWLGKGAHVVEILSADNGGGLRLSIVDDDGRPALAPLPKGRWTKPSPHRSRDGSPLTPILLPPTLDGKDASGLANAILRLHAARFGFFANDEEASIRTRELAAAYGWSPVAAAAVAMGIEGDTLPQPTLLAMSDPYWRVVEAHWPDTPLPQLTRARSAVDDQPEMALTHYRELARRAPRYPIGLRELAGQLCDRELYAEATTVTTSLLALRRGREELNAAIRANSGAGNHSVAARLVDERTRRFDGRNAQLRAALERGDDLRGVVSSAVAEAGDDASAVLELTGAVLDAAELVDPAAAATIIDAALVASPDASSFALRKLQNRQVVAEIQAALTQSTSLDTILLAIANGGIAPWQGLADTGDDAVAARRAGSAPFKDAGAVFLRFDRERHFADDGTSLVMRHWLVEVRSKEAIDAIGELRKGDDELLIRLTVHGADGTRREPEHHAGVKDISLTGLTPGDVVEWLSVAADDTAANGAFWEIEGFARPWPTVQQSTITTWPASLEERRAVVAIGSEGAPSPQRRRVNDRVELRYTADNIDGVLDEAHAAAGTDDIPQAGIAIDLADDFIATLRRQQLRSLRTTDPWLVDVGATIAGRGTELERLERLFYFVASRITEASSPSAPASTLATGRGQRLPLFAALAAGAGLSVEYWAVHGSLSPTLTLPSSQAFGAIVVAIDVGERVAVVGSFNDGFLFDRLPRAFENAAAFDIQSGAPRSLPAAAIDKGQIEIIVDLTLRAPAPGPPVAASVDDDTAQQLRGLGVVRLPAPIADPLRGALRGATDEQLQRFVESIFASSFPGVAATKVSVPGLKTVGGPLALVADLSVPLEATGQIRFEHLFADGGAAAMRAAAPLSSYVRTTTRRRTLVVAPHAERVEVVLRLPNTASVIEVPPPLDLVAGPFRLQQRSAVDDGTLRWERNITAEMARVSPAAWPPLRAALAPLITTSDAGLSVVLADRPSP